MASMDWWQRRFPQLSGRALVSSSCDSWYKQHFWAATVGSPKSDLTCINCGLARPIPTEVAAWASDLDRAIDAREPQTTAVCGSG